MALDHLLAALAHEAEATAERLRTEARAEAEKITALSTAVTDHRRQAEVDQVIRTRRDAVERQVAEARRAGREEALLARERLLARVGVAVRAAFPGVLATPRYRAALAQRLAGALACLEPGAPVSVRCAAALADPILAGWPSNPRVEVRADETLGSGYVLDSADGAIEIEDTLEARFAAQRRDLERRALQLLGVEG